MNGIVLYKIEQLQRKMLKKQVFYDKHLHVHIFYL
jgi:hypothetical protein